MIAIDNYNKIIKLIRPEIAEKLNININNIFNATAVTGPELYKAINEDESYSYNLGDCFIIFELVDSDKDNIIVQGENNLMQSVANYDFNMKIYGNYCHDMVHLLKMLFKNHDVAYKFIENGIYITDISNPSSINEFINGALWQRCDLSVGLTVIYENTIGDHEEETADSLGKLIINRIDNVN